MSKNLSFLNAGVVNHNQLVCQGKTEQNNQIYLLTSQRFFTIKKSEQIHDANYYHRQFDN